MLEFVWLIVPLNNKLQFCIPDIASVTLKIKETFPEVLCEDAAGDIIVMAGGTLSEVTVKFHVTETLEFLAALSSVQLINQL